MKSLFKIFFISFTIHSEFLFFVRIRIRFFFNTIIKNEISILNYFFLLLKFLLHVYFLYYNSFKVGLHRGMFTVREILRKPKKKNILSTTKIFRSKKEFFFYFLNLINSFILKYSKMEQTIKPKFFFSFFLFFFFSLNFA